MRKPNAALVVAVAIPFLASCFSVQARPLPAPEARGSTEIRGVVLRGEEEDERVEFERVDHVEWTDSTIIVTGVLDPSVAAAGGTATTPGTVTTRSFALSSVTGVLVHQFDSNRASIIIAVVGISAIAIATLLLTGQTDEGTVLGATSGRN